MMQIVQGHDRYTGFPWKMQNLSCSYDAKIASAMKAIFIIHLLDLL